MFRLLLCFSVFLVFVVFVVFGVVVMIVVLVCLFRCFCFFVFMGFVFDSTGNQHVHLHTYAYSLIEQNKATTNKRRGTIKHTQAYALWFFAFTYTTDSVQSLFPLLLSSKTLTSNMLKSLTQKLTNTSKYWLKYPIPSGVCLCVRVCVRV